MKLTTNRCLQGICHCEISIKPQMIFIFKTEYTESVLYPQMNLFPFILFSVKEWFLCLMSVFIEYAVRYYASKILNISHTKMSKFLMKNSTFHLFYSLKRDFCESQNILPFIRTWKEFSLLFVCVCVCDVSLCLFSTAVTKYFRRSTYKKKIFISLPFQTLQFMATYACCPEYVFRENVIVDA